MPSHAVRQERSEGALDLVTKRLGGLACPHFERPHEALFVLKSRFGRDLFDRARRAQQQIHRRVTPNAVLEGLQAGAFLLELSVQRAR